MAIEEVRKNKSAKRPNFHKGSLSHSPSQTNGDAMVQINSEIAIPKLQKLAETYFGVSDPHRFLTDLRCGLNLYFFFLLPIGLYFCLIVFYKNLQMLYTVSPIKNRVIDIKMVSHERIE